MIASAFGYARAEDGAYIGYRVDGEGPIDLVVQSDWPGNIDLDWQDPTYGAWLRQLSSIGRVITHDHRGVGVSSRDVDLPDLETRVRDLQAVLRAVGVRRAVLLGVFATGAVNVLLAAMHPKLVRAIVWSEPAPRFAWAPDYPWGRDEAEHELERGFIGLWGTDAYARASGEHEAAAGNILPAESIRFLAVQSRNACTPDVAARLADIWYETDVRDVLGAVQAPTLLLVHRDMTASLAIAEYVASRMPAAEVRAMPGDTWRTDEFPAWAAEVRQFIGLARSAEPFNTVLSTVLFTDIVDSTQRQASLGDRGWKGLIERHHAAVRRSLSRWGGTENDTAGDGFYATFDGPARAIRCASEIVAEVRDLGFEVRAGVHTGECELVEGKSVGITVSIGARVAGAAGPSDVLVSQTVKDLIAGSGLRLEDAGQHELKGVPERWRLYRVIGEPN